MFPLKSYGYLKYDPKNIKTRYKERWLIVNCDDELTEYYRRFIMKDYLFRFPSTIWMEKNKLKTDINWDITVKGLKTVRSAWGSHISVIRGEQLSSNILWAKYEGKKIEYNYNPETLNTNGKHWWIQIHSKDLQDIRLELGLTSEYNYLHRDSNKILVSPMHLTIGHIAL